MNNVKLTKENLKENKKFTSLLVIIILIVGLGFALLIKLNRDAQIAAIMKELNTSSQSSVQSIGATTPTETKIEKLLRMSKVVTTVKSNLLDLNIEAALSFKEADLGIKIDQTL